MGMDQSEKQVIASLLLLLGLTMLVAGLEAGQLDLILNFLRSVFEAAIAGSP